MVVRAEQKEVGSLWAEVGLSPAASRAIRLPSSSLHTRSNTPPLVAGTSMLPKSKRPPAPLR